MTEICQIPTNLSDHRHPGHGIGKGLKDKRLSLLRSIPLQCALILVVSVLWQQRWGTIVDTSWLITALQRNLGGERLYVDVVENNPPFTFWFFLPSVIVSNWLGVASETVIEVYTYLMVLLGLGMAAMIVRRAGLAEQHILFRQAPLFVALFVIFPGIAFTERDQIGAALSLPLFALMAWRAEGGKTNMPGWADILAASICGSVLVLFKPYYIAAYAAPALYVAWRRRNLWSLFAPENCIIALLGAIYVGLVVWLCPEFVHNVLPQVAEIYMQSGSSLWVTTRYTPSFIAILLLIWLVAPREPLTPLSTIVILAALGSFGALVYQGKGWPYHAFPAFSMGLIAVLCRIAASPLWRGARLPRKPVVFCALVTVCIWTPFLHTQKPAAAMVAAVKSAATPTSTLAIIGDDMAGAHPLARMAGTRFPSSTNSDWLGFMAFTLSRAAQAEGNEAAASDYKRQADAYLDKKYAEFVRYNYDFIVVEEDKPLWKTYVLDQPRFAVIMSAYHPIAASERFTVFGRNEPPKD